MDHLFEQSRHLAGGGTDFSSLSIAELAKIYGPLDLEAMKVCFFSRQANEQTRRISDRVDIISEL